MAVRRTGNSWVEQEDLSGLRHPVSKAVNCELIELRGAGRMVGAILVFSVGYGQRFTPLPNDEIRTDGEMAFTRTLIPKDVVLTDLGLDAHTGRRVSLR